MGDRGLGRLAGDFLASVLLFQRAPDTQPFSPAALRAHLLAQLDALARHPDVSGISGAELDEARFALVAFADEMVLRSGWAGHAEWQREPLQLQLFRTNRAGNEFYDHLSRLRPEQVDAREVYFLCLALGFEGQYAGHEGERRAVLQDQLSFLRAAGRALEPGRDGWLVPPAYDTAIRLTEGRRRGVGPALLAFAGVALALFGLLWGVLRFAAGGVPLPPGG